MEIKSRDDKIVMNAKTGRFEKTSIITSEMTAEELRNYRENLARQVKLIELELRAIRLEMAQIDKLLGGTRE